MWIGSAWAAYSAEFKRNAASARFLRRRYIAVRAYYLSWLRRLWVHLVTLDLVFLRVVML